MTQQSMKTFPAQRPPAKKNTGAIWSIIGLLVIIGGVVGVFMYFNNQASDDSSDTGEGVTITSLTEEETVTDTDVEEEAVVEEEEDSNPNTVEDTAPTPSDTDFSDYSEEDQSVGTKGSDEYELASVVDSSEDRYHKFVFQMEGKDSATDAPNITARYSASLGSIRVGLNMTTTDTSGIAYQAARSVGEEGVTQLYHNISADNTEELYDIGVAQSTPFHLSSTETDTGMWDIVVLVKYPGASTLSIDLGSTAFSTDLQEIDGATSTDGAKVSGYSYSSSGGVLRVVFLVSGSTAKPIPSASAAFDGTVLKLTYSSLSSDVVRNGTGPVDLPGGVTMDWVASGSGTVYSITGVSGNDFKLSATQSPNQVILEMEL